MLIAMAGLPASGKSAVARRLSHELEAVLLDKDQVRACLFADYVEYSRTQDDLCVSVMYDVACYHLEQRPGTPVILDGRTYSRGYQIDAVTQTAIRAEVALYIIECVCSSETALMRLMADRDTHPAQDRDALLYEKSRAAAEPIVEPRLILNTDDRTEDQCAQIALGYVREQRGS